MSEALVTRLRAALGRENVLVGSAASDILEFDHEDPAAILLRPRSTAHVSAGLAICHAFEQPVTLVGGRTGLVGGARVQAGEVAMTLVHLDRIEEIDRTQACMTVQAGVVLQRAQETAEAAGFMLPVDIGARGSATIGGNVATNAGGNRVLRFGSMRALVLGLEVVLADGTVIDAASKIRKDNAGYDLKQLFIGSEGTLGVVTRVVLALVPRPPARTTALVSLPSFNAVARLLERARSALGPRLASFEVMWKRYYDLVTRPPAHGRPIVPADQPFYVLCETLGEDRALDEQAMLTILDQAMADGIVVSGTLGVSSEKQAAIWGLRDDVDRVLHRGWASLYDVSLPIESMADFAERVEREVFARWPTAECYIFGHVADGNLHLAIVVDDPADEPEIQRIVYGALPATGSSVSAEHGIGLDKRPWLAQSRTPEEIALMRTLKTALDPRNILNRGRILGPNSEAEPS